MELEKYKKQWQEAQTTLEELGIQLSVSKIQVHELKEKVQSSKLSTNKQNQPSLLNINNDSNSSSTTNNVVGTWTPDSMTSKCKGCSREFSITRRKVSYFNL